MGLEYEEVSSWGLAYFQGRLLLVSGSVSPGFCDGLSPQSLCDGSPEAMMVSNRNFIFQLADLQVNHVEKSRCFRVMASQRTPP